MSDDPEAASSKTSDNHKGETVFCARSHEQEFLKFVVKTLWDNKVYDVLTHFVTHLEELLAACPGIIHNLGLAIIHLSNVDAKNDQEFEVPMLEGNALQHGMFFSSSLCVEVRRSPRFHKRNRTYLNQFLLNKDRLLRASNCAKTPRNSDVSFDCNIRALHVI